MSSFCTTFFDNVFCTWVHTLHVTLGRSSVFGLTRFMLRWTRVLYFSFYVGHVFCTSVRTLHVTLDTCSVLRFAHFMLRWTRLLYFSWDTSCCVGHVFCTSVDTLHVTLGTFLSFGSDSSCCGLQVGMGEKEVLALWRNAKPSKTRNVF